MDSFRTVLPVQPAGFQITHDSRLLLIGSCFTELIGQRLQDYKFRVKTNPNGIVYNPVSMAESLDRLMSGNRPYEASELVENAGLWHSWDHHGHFSKPGRAETLQAINDAYATCATYLAETDVLLLTLGTASVFCLDGPDRIVANNHKMPASLFRQKRLSVAQATESLEATLQRLRERTPGLRVVLNVSPVRHLRDGLVENQRSKAVLVLACEALCNRFSWVSYFPSYELLLDDLRDYRFYAADMVHPSDLAVDYVWEHFTETYFPALTRELLTAIGKILSAARHRPFHPGTPAHRAFAEAQLAAIDRLIKAYPGLDFSEEKAYFEAIIRQA